MFETCFMLNITHLYSLFGSNIVLCQLVMQDRPLDSRLNVSICPGTAVMTTVAIVVLVVLRSILFAKSVTQEGHDHDPGETNLMWTNVTGTTELRNLSELEQGTTIGAIQKSNVKKPASMSGAQTSESPPNLGTQALQAVHALHDMTYPTTKETDRTTKRRTTPNITENKLLLTTKPTTTLPPLFHNQSLPGQLPNESPSLRSLTLKQISTHPVLHTTSKNGTDAPRNACTEIAKKGLACQMAPCLSPLHFQLRLHPRGSMMRSTSNSIPGGKCKSFASATSQNEAPSSHQRKSRNDNPQGNPIPLSDWLKTPIESQPPQTPSDAGRVVQNLSQQRPAHAQGQTFGQMFAITPHLQDAKMQSDSRVTRVLRTDAKVFICFVFLVVVNLCLDN